MKLDIGTPTKLDVFSGMNVKMSVACGENHTLAVINSEEGGKKMLWGWGMFKSGQLGLGEVSQKQNPRVLQTLYNTSVFKVSCGSVTSMAVLGDPAHLSRAYSPNFSAL
jgi:alpha-tubulin suppressor-like RCC1 family protein